MSCRNALMSLLMACAFAIIPPGSMPPIIAPPPCIVDPPCPDIIDIVPTAIPWPDIIAPWLDMP